MPWAVKQSEMVDLDTTEESEFYVSPHVGSLDFTINFIVHHRRIPVFLEVETFRSLTLLSARESADDQMRQSFREFASATIPTPILYGLSAFGPRFCVYAFDSATQRIDPPTIARDLVIVNNIAPAARWAHNLLEPAGEAKFREVVNAVMGMTQDLPKRLGLSKSYTTLRFQA
ncbi:hypothetical protein BDN70DRAFT_938861 [Pholiota conissans]|uniref:Uncharacterized protein n=1 Tax=Pholiota conissans TaxID=109636 RepID=A0A9P5YLV9_9AGAR|nr:hypothetical protein BDN70DRAFT_938861 [Pholiota conissans]